MLVTFETDHVEKLLAALPENSRKRPGLEWLLRIAKKAALRPRPVPEQKQKVA